MQTAVDRNGGNSNSNTSITATTTTLVESSSSDLLSLDATTTRSASTVILSPLTVLEQPSVLRHRLQMGVGVGVGVVKDAIATTSYQHKIGATHHLIDVAEYLGSNVERMSLTPSSSPQASPSRKCQHSAASARASTKPSISAVVADAAASIMRTTAVPAVTDVGSSNASSNSSASSQSNSSSHSAASSVIASPVIARNGNTFPTDSNDNMKEGNIGDANGECRRKALTPRSASFAAFEEHCLSMSGGTITEVSMTPLQLSSSSSSSLSPATTTTTASASSASSASSTPITPPTKSPSEDAQLLQWQDMPTYLQFNPYVRKGYRPLQTFKGCLLSLFYWHNETINILTHAIPIVYILATVPGLMPWEQEFRFLSFCHLFGSVAPWCGSFVYHLFMNIEKGENVYYRLLKLDMVGIWVSQSFGALPLVTATTFCFSYKWKWFIIIAYCLLSLWGLYKALTASSPWQRRLCFALPFTMRSILTLLRTLGLVGGNRIAMAHVYLQDGVSILGGAIGAMRIPEKWFPGLVDFYLNSHNIMHVLVVVAVYSMHKATMKDFEWMSTANCNAIINATGEAIETTLTSNVEL